MVMKKPTKITATKIQRLEAMDAHLQRIHLVILPRLVPRGLERLPLGFQLRQLLPLLSNGGGVRTAGGITARGDVGWGGAKQ